MTQRDDLARAHPAAPLAHQIRNDAPIRLLVVDDDAEIRGFFTALLAEHGYAVTTASSAQEAMERMLHESFDAMLFDIVLPDGNGLELLRKTHAILPEVPIIMITGRADVEMARSALREGACDFVTKPCHALELPIIIERNLLRHSIEQRNRLRHQHELQTSYESVLDALLSALDTRSTETQGHSERVTAYTMLLADAMGVAEEDRYHIERGALLHDIGKIGIPDRILLKAGPLSPEEWEEMKRHPIIGYRMCSRIDFLQGAAKIVLHHHERWDGSGYPDGLAGEDIPLGARIFAIADALDAMITERPYRQAISFEEAAAEIARNRGTQFDPQVVDVFLSIPERRWRDIRERFRK